jgi:hypothetical protein
LLAHTVSAAEPSAQRFATVWRIQGDVTATAAATGTVRTLRLKDSVFVGEEIRAASSAEALLNTDDAGIIAIRPQAVFVIDKFEAEGKSTDQFALRLLKGGLRLITGWVGRTNPGQYRISTLTATIGIRGTDHEPYEMSADLASALQQRPGTYDKVNRGGTTMDVKGNTLDIDPGKVGFASGADKSRSRGLMTIALPVLLDLVPNFYVPGQFDDELDRLSPAADQEALRKLNERNKGLPATPPRSAPATKPDAKPAQSPSATTTPPSPNVTAANAGACAPQAIATTWLAAFDAAIARRDAPAVIAMFAPETSVSVTVRNANGEASTVQMNRDELARSTIAAVSGLTDYSQRRPAIDASLAQGSANACDRIVVKSLVIEQGRQNGRPYRFESTEEYLLVNRAGVWLAVKADATQR